MDWQAWTTDWSVWAAGLFLLWLLWPKKGRRRQRDDAGAARAGLAGELQVATEIRRLGCKVLHDVFLPYLSGRGHAQIDLLVLTSAGIAVVEVKRWAGTIHVDPSADQWTIVSRSGTRERRHSPLAQNALHVRALKEQFPEATFVSVVVMVGGELRGTAHGVYDRVPDWLSPGSPDSATRATWSALTIADGRQDKERLARAHKDRVRRAA